MNVGNPALIRTLLLGLVSEYQRGDDCNSCPLSEKSKFSYPQKKDWIRSLGDDDLKQSTMNTAAAWLPKMSDT